MLEAIDYVQIQNVLNFYPFVVDVPENYGKARDIFTSDGIFDAGDFGRYEGIEALIEYWSHSAARAAALEKSQLLAHNMANIYIFEDSEGTVRVYSRCVGVSKSGMASVAVYHDVMRKTADGWRIAYRKLMPMEPPTVTLR